VGVFLYARYPCIPLTNSTNLTDFTVNHKPHALNATQRRKQWRGRRMGRERPQHRCPPSRHSIPLWRLQEYLAVNQTGEQYGHLILLSGIVYCKSYRTSQGLTVSGYEPWPLTAWQGNRPKWTTVTNMGQGWGCAPLGVLSLAGWPKSSRPTRSGT
jgi:hypothetical protein